MSPRRHTRDTSAEHVRPNPVLPRDDAGAQWHEWWRTTPLSVSDPAVPAARIDEANTELWASDTSGGGVGLFAHIGGFVFGFSVTRVLLGLGRVQPLSTSEDGALGMRPPARGG